MDRDKSIIIQVAAKIASDLTTTDGVNSETKVSEFAVIFSDIKDILLESIYGNVAVPAVAEPQPLSPTEVQQIAQIQQSFPTAQPVATGSVRIKGKQHGPIPDWLVIACQRDGVTEVWDNRDGVAANPKRPWFKAVNGDKAYWQPR